MTTENTNVPVQSQLEHNVKGKGKAKAESVDGDRSSMRECWRREVERLKAQLRMTRMQLEFAQQS